MTIGNLIELWGVEDKNEKEFKFKTLKSAKKRYATECENAKNGERIVLYQFTDIINSIKTLKSNHE